jgi:hypothetical protein
LFADDLIISNETEEELQEQLLHWQEALEKGGLMMNTGKTKVMATSKQDGVRINIKDRNNKEIGQEKYFKYLGTTLSEHGGCEVDVKERVKARWNKWREITGVICIKTISRNLKIKMYETVIRPVILYGSENWGLRKAEERLLSRTEMRMLRWIMGISLREQRRNEDIKQEAGVEIIIEKAREQRLR